MRAFSPRFDPAPADALAAAESRLGVTFPDEYRAFLHTPNGLLPETGVCFTVPDRGDVLLGSLYGVGRERSAGDLEHEQAEATMWHLLPAGYIAVGDDPGGNLLLLATLGDDSGRVYFWDRVGLWVREDGRNLFPVANSFEQFLAGLWDMPQQAEPGAAPDRGLMG
jgi:hypothetical protein